MVDTFETPRRTHAVRPIILAIILAFVCGMAATVWALRRWDAAHYFLLPPAAASTSTMRTAPTTAPAPTAPSAAIDPSMIARIGTLEDRLDTIDRHVALSSQQASQAENLLILSAARRAVTRGVPLGYLEGALATSFGKDQPRAVGNIIATSQHPVTLDMLERGLAMLAADPRSATTPPNWWNDFRKNIGSLIIVHRAGDTTLAPDERLARAKLLVVNGAVDQGLTEVARLPASGAATAWEANAKRYIEAQAALDLLEASVVLAAKPVPPPDKEAHIKAHTDNHDRF